MVLARDSRRLPGREAVHNPKLLILGERRRGLLMPHNDENPAVEKPVQLRLGRVDPTEVGEPSARERQVLAQSARGANHETVGAELGLATQATTSRASTKNSGFTPAPRLSSGQGNEG